MSEMDADESLMLLSRRSSYHQRKLSCQDYLQLSAPGLKKKQIEKLSKGSKINNKIKILLYRQVQVLSPLKSLYHGVKVMYLLTH